MKKLISLALAMFMLCSVSMAFAKTLAPDNSSVEHLEGTTVHATVGAYHEAAKVLTVTLYKEDEFEQDDVEKLAAGICSWRTILCTRSKKRRMTKMGTSR